MESRKRTPLERPAASAVGIWSWHVPTDQVTLSEATYRIYGIDPATFRGTFAECMEVVHPDDLGHIEEVSSRALAEKRGFPVEFRVVRPDGEERLVRADADVFIAPDGEVERMAGMVQDVTEERAVQRKRHRLTTAMEQLAEAVFITDGVGRLRYVNAAFERITGYAREDLLERDLEMFRGDDRYGEMRASAERGEAWAGRLRGTRRDGSHFLVDTTLAPVQDGGDEIVSFAGVQRDVTREVALEEQLRHVQKMEAVGMLAGGIAHDFNNLLIAIIGHSDLLLMKSQDDPDVQRHAGEVRKAGERARELTSQLLAFGRKQVLHPGNVDLRDVLADMESLLHRMLGDDASLEIMGGNEPATVWADAHQMEQVIQNLATNARDAMPTGGTVRIGISVADLGHADCELPTSPAPGRHVLLRVSDTGLGMDDETRGRIFEPFFSTKSMNMGSGLGLATVYGIVRQSGGGIHVHSEVGEGTTFEICLPLSIPEAESGECPTAPSAGTAGHETILVAEDEPLVASIVKNTLRAQGYTILSAEDGRQALDLAAAHDGPIDLLLTDVVMPRMGGVELARALSTRRPGLRVLYSSGYTGDALVQRGVLLEDVDLLQKPYSPSALVERVRAALDAERPRASLTG